MTTTAQQITEWADTIMAEIRKDMENGLVPATVTSFSELHDHVDANDYALEAVPFTGPSCTCVRTEASPGCDCAYAEAWDAYMELLNEVESAVDSRIKAGECSEAAQITDDEPCPKCEGRMARSGDTSETCETCGYTWNLRP